MNQNLKLSFVNPEGKDCDSYITWTPSKMRIHIPSHFKKELLILDQSSFEVDKSTLPEEFHSQITTPEVLFYNIPLDKEDKGVSSMTIDLGRHLSAEDIFVYVGGKFQKGKLYHGASPDSKDIKITAKLVTDRKEKIVAEVSEDVMIRVRKNANQLTTKAKKDFLVALSSINERDKEGNARNLYSSDFFDMHVKGSESIAHGTEVFLPWHRLYILDLERQLQRNNKNVSLHYWKFDEKAEHIFKKDFMGEALIDDDVISPLQEGYSSVFARFNEDNPLNDWSINKEKLLRRKALFNHQKDQAGLMSLDDNNIQIRKYSLSEYLSISNKKQLSLKIIDKDGKEDYTEDSLTTIEGNPHGRTHISHNGFINFVPTAPKDPIFFFLHSNVDRLWCKWQTLNAQSNTFDPNQKISFPNQEENKNDWKNINSRLWPWNGRSTPNEFNYKPSGSRSLNFTTSLIVKNFSKNSPAIKDSIDAFGYCNLENNLGFGYDDANSYGLEYIFENNLTSKIINQVKNRFSEINDGISDFNLKHLKSKVNKLDKINESIKNLKFASTSNLSTNSLVVNNILNQITLNKIVSNKEFQNIVLFKDLLKLLFSKAETIEQVDAILLQLVHADDRDIIHQLEILFHKIKYDSYYKTEILFYNGEYDKTGKEKPVDYSQVSESDGYESKEFSKSLVIYLLALYDFEFLQDEQIEDFFVNNKYNLFEQILLNDNKIALESDLDLLIALLSFASNSYIVSIYNEYGSKSVSDHINEMMNENNLVDKYSQRISNKFWALNTLINNAYKKNHSQFDFSSIKTEELV